MVLLCVLQALHVYWYTLFLQMGLAFLKSGKTEDTQVESATQPVRALANERVRELTNARETRAKPVLPEPPHE